MKTRYSELDYFSDRQLEGDITLVLGIFVMLYFVALDDLIITLWWLFPNASCIVLSSGPAVFVAHYGRYRGFCCFAV